tara:strand:+ start:101 stop:319 length:219 start_codon:yes stop_codon:yes gene_type:complete
MTPIYEYKCRDGHKVEKIRPYSDRDEPVKCQCRKVMRRMFSAHYRQPDGIYSYEENCGRPELVEKMMDAPKD